jgi:hypothetical protein
MYRLAALLLVAGCSERFDEDETADGPVTPHDTDPTDSDTDTGASLDPNRPLELCINEFMPANTSSVQDETSAWPDWIELHNPGDSPVVLDGWMLSDFRYEPDKYVFDAGTTLAAGGYLLLWADGLPDTGPDHLGFKLDEAGGEVTLYAPDGRGSIVTYGPMAADFSIARVPNCCTGDECLTFDFRGSPGVSNIDPVYEDELLLPAGSVWHYWDQGTNPGAGWETSGFDDLAWPSGPGPLGFGDAHQVTITSYGPDPANKYVTTWFRATLPIADIDSIHALDVGLLRDDSARVYLNGVEVLRDNLPDGDLTDTTLALVSTGGANETAYWEYTLEPTALVPGINTLAVEVHQSAIDSSDLGFDMSLTAERLVSE